MKGQALVDAIDKLNKTAPLCQPCGVRTVVSHASTQGDQVSPTYRCPICSKPGIANPAPAKSTAPRKPRSRRPAGPRSTR